MPNNNLNNSGGTGHSLDELFNYCSIPISTISSPETTYTVNGRWYIRDYTLYW